MYGTYISHSTRHHLFFSPNYSPNQKNALYSLSFKINLFFNLWMEKPLTAIRAISVRAREPWSNREGTEPPFKTPITTVQQAPVQSAFLERSTSQDRRKAWSQARTVFRMKRDSSFCCLFYEQEHKTTNVYVAFQTSPSNTD